MKYPKTFNALILTIVCSGLLVTLAFGQGRGPGGHGPDGAGPGGRGGHGPGGPGPGGPPPPERGRLALHLLDLTEAQKAQINAIHASENAKAQAFHEQLRESHDALQAATIKGQFDEAQVRALAASIAQNEIELTVIRARKDAAIYQALTAEQRAKLDQFHAEREAHRPPPPPRQNQ
jgi:Spy/CpxP family protein refolding chaperone